MENNEKRLKIQQTIAKVSEYIFVMLIAFCMVLGFYACQAVNAAPVYAAEITPAITPFEGNNYYLDTISGLNDNAYILVKSIGSDVPSDYHVLMYDDSNTEYYFYRDDDKGFRAGGATGKSYTVYSYSSSDNNAPGTWSAERKDVYVGACRQSEVVKGNAVVYSDRNKTSVLYNPPPPPPPTVPPDENVENVVDSVGTLGTGLWGVAQDAMDFIVENPVVLIGLILFVIFAGSGLLQSLVKGV